ncbi:hypothetical protein HYT23_03585 [Candidatus Pacearchaeota archaeon]|nr:hypothetical protein [Candidatus Pacearchaeota archaeon]
MSLLDNLDPAKIFGLESPEKLPNRIMNRLRSEGEYAGIISSYRYIGGKIIKENSLTGRCTFYDSDGKNPFQVNKT